MSLTWKSLSSVTFIKSLRATIQTLNEDASPAQHRDFMAVLTLKDL